MRIGGWSQSVKMTGSRWHDKDNCVFTLGCTRSSVGAEIRRRLATDNELSLIMGDSTLRHSAQRKAKGDLITVVFGVEWKKKSHSFLSVGTDAES